MATVGDLVVRMTVDNGPYVQGIQQAARENASLLTSSTQLAQGLRAAEAAMTRFSTIGAGSPGMQRSMQMMTAGSQVDESRSAANTRLINEQMQNQGLLAQRAATSLAQLGERTAQLNLETQQLNAALNNEAHVQALVAQSAANAARAQAEQSLAAKVAAANVVEQAAAEQRLAASYRESVAARAAAMAQQQQLDADTRRAAQDAERVAREIAERERLAAGAAEYRAQVVARAAASEAASRVATDERARAQQADAQATQLANNELAKREKLMTFLIGAEQKEAAATMLSTRAHHQNSAAMMRSNVLVSNAIFAVEDASSVYGTQGFAGAVRAASNNITMMAMTLGGVWGAAIAVAITAVTQLWMAFSKTKDHSKEAAQALEQQANAHRRIKDSIDEEISALHRRNEFEKEWLAMRGKGSEATGGAMQDRTQDIAEMDARVEKLRQAERQFQGAAAVAQGRVRDLELQRYTKSGAERFMSGHAKSLEEAEAAVKRNQLDAAKIGGEINKILEERRTTQEELRKITLSHNGALMDERYIREETARRAAETAKRERNENTARGRAETLRDIRRDLDDTLNPNGSGARKIAEEFMRRKAMIESSLTGTSAVEMSLRQNLLDRNQRAALKEMQAGLTPRDRLRNAGPSMAVRGSREDLEQERQRILNRQAPKDQTPDLLKKLNAEVGKVLVEMKLTNQHQKRELELLENADNGSFL